MYFVGLHLFRVSLIYIKPLSVGVAGFEPATSCSQSRRDNRATLHPGLSVKKCLVDIFSERASWRAGFNLLITAQVFFNFMADLSAEVMPAA